MNRPAPQRGRIFPSVFEICLAARLNRRDRVPVEVLLRDRAELHPRRQLVDEPVPGLLVAEALPLVEAGQRGDPIHVHRVEIAARQLEHQLRLLDDRLRRHHQHRRDDVVDRHHVEDQLGRDRQHVLPLERQIDQRRRGGEPFVPAPKRIGDRALDDGRPDDGAHDAGLARHQLVAHALGVGVDVGPAPGRRALDPLLGHLGADPLLARARHRQLQRRLVVGIAVLLAQPLARLLAQPRQHLRVVGQLADARRARRAVGDLLLDGELRPRQLPWRGK